MDKQRIKTVLIRLLGEKITAQINGMRLASRIKKNKFLDPEASLIGRFAKRGDIAVDVGANGADWSYQMYHITGREGRVFAFEADPYYARVTAVVIGLMSMKGVQLFSFGLSDKEEEVPLRVLDGGNQRVSGWATVDKSATRDQAGITMIRLKTLDSLVPKYPELLRTAFFKCDVEGYELFVFRGAKEIITKARPAIVLEIGNFQKQGYSAQDVHVFFKAMDYLAFAFIPSGRLARTDALLEHPMAVNVNRLLLPAEKLSNVRDLLEPST